MVGIDGDSPVPTYAQLRDQIAGMVAAGTLAAGDRLPTIRQLSGDLGIAPGTVQRTYNELLAAGTIVSRGRHGTFVCDDVVPLAADEVARRLRDAASRLVLLARQLGRSEQDALDAVRAAIPAHRS